MTAGARDASDPRARLRAIESTIEDLSRVADARSLAGARALVGEVLALHAEGIARILEILGAKGTEAGVASPLDSLVADERVASLLLLHGLHPVPLERRVRAALGKVAPLGWTLELAGSSGAVVRVVASRVGDSKRAPKAEQVKALVEQAIEEAAPDAESVEVTALGEDAPEGFVPLERLTAPRPAADGAPR
jgi:hypothetical protein